MSADTMPIIKLGVPKGSLEDATINLFERAGWKIRKHTRNYFPDINDPQISASLCRVQEIGEYIEAGVLDVGITGLDWLTERNHEDKVVHISELVYSKTSNRPCRWVLAVAGTHGKTTTAGMATWILEQCGYKPGFVIGGVPGNFEVSARLGESDFFVIEADEYDCAFFDKRSKFVHYCPRTLILNNLEFDHADIFDDLKAIQKQFHHLVRIVPGQGRIIYPENDINLKQTMAMGCWSEQELVGEQGHWQAKKLNADASQWEVLLDGEKVGEVKWALVGEHNMHNGLMAIAAARHVGVLPADAANALGSFINARRRLELRGEANGVTVYDDFAHHPTAILATLQALRGKVGGTARILAVLEPRSNTMKMGISKDDLAPSLGRADEVFLFQPQHIPWQVSEVADACVQPAHWHADLDTLVDMIVKTAQPGDHILVMSNGGFGGIHQKLLDALAEKARKSAQA